MVMFGHVYRIEQLALVVVLVLAVKIGKKKKKKEVEDRWDEKQQCNINIIEHYISQASFFP